MARCRVQLVPPDRPGYGLSDPHTDGTYLQYGRDIEELAHRLKVGRFAVFGFSGGGPSALACRLDQV